MTQTLTISLTGTTDLPPGKTSVLPGVFVFGTPACAPQCGIDFHPLIRRHRP